MICESCKGDGLINQEVAGGVKVCKECSGTGKVSVVEHISGEAVEALKPEVETTEEITEPETENTEPNKPGLMDRILGN